MDSKGEQPPESSASLAAESQKKAQGYDFRFVRMVPRSVHLGMETLESYSLRRAAQDNAREANRRARNEQFREACERCQRYFANPKIRAYWLDQIRATFPCYWVGPEERQLNMHSAEDRGIAYTALAFAVDAHSACQIIPEDLRVMGGWGDFYRRISARISDISSELLAWIEADLRERKLLLPSDGSPDQGETASRVENTANGNESQESPACTKSELSDPEEPVGSGQLSRTAGMSKSEAQPTDTEEYILKALGKEHMTGPMLLKKAGYDYSSHYRQILSHLVKRGILGNDNTGYFRRDT
jgi:hypothetical protein